MTNAKWMMVGLMLGFSASTVLSCGPAVKACGPKECPFGCCDERGSCQVGSSDSQCGAQGNVCSACMLAQRCQLGLCTNIGSGGGGGSGGGTGGGSGGGITGGGTGGGVTGGGTGGGVTGGGTGGGVTGGGTGGGITGGGTGGGGACGPANCSGCCNFGSCVQVPNNVNDATCGRNGNVCNDCTALSGAICSPSSFSCVFGPAGGGGGGAVGGGGGTTGGGGGTTCTGCMNGTACVPYATSSQATSTCGGGAAACLSCTGGLCSAGNCTTSAPTGIISNGRVRLVDGDGLASGRLEVFDNGGWGQVCDDEFDVNLNGPNVVCRDLGFPGAISQGNATGVGDFFLLDDVICAGTEAQLLMCPHTIGFEDCGSSEAVFITCGP